MNLFDRNDILPSPRKIGRLDENVVVIPNANSIPILNKTYSIYEAKGEFAVDTKPPQRLYYNFLALRFQNVSKINNTKFESTKSIPQHYDLNLESIKTSVIRRPNLNGTFPKS